MILLKKLTIDTATSFFAAALLDGSMCVAKTSFEVQRDHSSFAMPAIVDLFQKVEWKLTDIDEIIVTQGPGSYTGVRIGVTIAKTLAYANQCSLVGVSTLHLLAANCEQEDVLIVPLIDAKRQEVFTGFYTYDGNDWQCVQRDQVINIHTLVQILQMTKKPIVFVGKDVQLFTETLMSIPNSSVLSEVATDGEKIAKISKYYDHQIDIHTFAPNYYKLSQAEADLLKRQQGV